MKIWPASIGWILLLVSAVFVSDGRSIHAQVSGPSISIFPPAPRSLRQNLVRAKKAIEDERFSDAVTELGTVLTGTNLTNQPAAAADDNQDYFVEVPGQTGTQTSIKAEAQRLLGSLPPRGRELFELQFGADARALLDAAAQDADINQLNEVIRRYFHTAAGYEAALLLGRLHLDHGRPLAAALCLQRVANVPSAASRFEPELSLLLAACWQLARQPDRAEAVLGSLPVQLPRGQVRFGDKELRELPRSQESTAWLTEHFHIASSDAAEVRNWLLYRGNPARNAVSSGGLPLKRSRWQVPLVRDDRDRDLLEEARINFLEQGTPVLPVVQPLAVGNIVVMRTSEWLVGIGVETGKRVWRYPFWDLSSDEESPNSNPLSVSPPNPRDNRLSALRERLWQDAPFGQVSSDGNSVFFLDRMRQTAPQNPRQLRWNRARGMNFPISDPWILQNELVALDLQREGYMLWKVGGDDGNEEPKLAGAFFLGPPLPLFGQLYLIAEIKGELKLIVLDAATGKQQWSQQLAHLEAMIGIDEQVRRYSGATPSFADGVLICPTAVGAVVAVDIATRSLLWGHQYSSNREVFNRNAFMQQFPTQPNFPSNRWQDASVTIAEGSVLITPPESDLLICLDLLTGKPRWEPLPRTGEMADMLYVAGVHNGNAVLVGKDRVLAVRLDDGKSAWDHPAILQKSDSEMPSGRGFLSNHHFYLPTTKSNLLKIDLRNGQIASRSKTDHVLGNLICYGDEIISVAADRASTFYQIDPLRSRIAEKLNKSPDDAWALARHGELLVHDGKTSEALQVLHRAHDRNRQDEGVRTLLVDTFLSALNENFKEHRAMAPEIAGLIDNDAQRTKYLLLMADGSQKANDLAGATEHYSNLVRLMWTAAKKIPQGEAFSLLNPDGNSMARADRFVSARLADLYQCGDSHVREKLDALVAELGVAARSGAVAELRSYLQLCGFHPGTDLLRIAFAEKLITSSELLEAEMAITPLLRRDDARLAEQAKGTLERIITAAKKPQLASLGWPWGSTAVNESREPMRQTIYAIHPTFPILERRGTALENIKLELDFQRGNTSLRDGNGNAVLRLPDMRSGGQEPGLWRTAADGHLLFIAIGGQIIALDTLRSRANENDLTLWREALWNPDTDSTKPLPRERRNPLVLNQLPEYRWGDLAERPIASIGPMTANGVCIQKIRAITCMDPLTGTTLWSRNDFEQGCELFGDNEFVFVCPADRKPKTPRKSDPNAAPPADVESQEDLSECTVLSVVDGRSLGKRRLPLPAQRWTTRGRNVLAWEQQDKDIRLFLYDVQEQTEIWTERFSEGSRGCLVDSNSVAVLQTDGRLVMRSLFDAEQKLETTVEPTNGLVSIQAILSSQQLLLVINDSQMMPAEIDTGRRGISSVLQPINGRIFSLDRKTGRKLWQVPAVVRGFGMLPNQPEEVPTLWFLRPRSISAQQFGPAATGRVDVVCLDRRTGAPILEKNDVASQMNSFDLVCDVRKGEVTLALPQVQFNVRFTADPHPPAPPFHQPGEATGMHPFLKKAGDLMESMKDVFGPGANDDPFK